MKFDEVAKDDEERRHDDPFPASGALMSACFTITRVICHHASRGCCLMMADDLLHVTASGGGFIAAAATGRGDEDDAQMALEYRLLKKQLLAAYRDRHLMMSPNYN